MHDLESEIEFVVQPAPAAVAAARQEPSIIIADPTPASAPAAVAAVKEFDEVANNMGQKPAGTEGAEKDQRHASYVQPQGEKIEQKIELDTGDATQAEID